MRKYIKAMVFYFDYFYYRIAKFYTRYKYGTKLSSHAFALIVFVESILVLSVAETCLMLFWEKPIIRQVMHNKEYILMVCFLTASVFNFYRYKGKYEELDNHWKNETKRISILKAMLMLISVVMAFAIFDVVTARIYVLIDT